MRIGADPLGGASVAYWGEIGERHGLDLTVVNPRVDPQWAFMTLDWDGKIRMDCSSPSAMASLIHSQGRLRHLHGQRRRRRPPRHRHPRRGADEPQPLPCRRDPVPLRRRPTRLAREHRHRQDPRLVVDDRPGRRRPRPARCWRCRSGSSGSCPGSSTAVSDSAVRSRAGARFLRFDGTVWSTDKDGILLALLASEILAVTGKTPSQHYAELTARHGDPAYARIDAAASREEKAKLGALSPDDVTAHDPCRRADHRQADRGARQRRQDRRPQGDDRERMVRRPALRHRGRLQDLCRVLPGPEHLARVQAEAKDVVSAALGG